jgi:glycosyltransferase involved in cell wall biosynthesis
MKVLHVIPAVAPRYGGPSQAVLGTTRAVAEQGVEVLIATTDADGATRLPVHLGVQLKYQDVPAIFFRRQFSESFKYSRPLARWLDAHVTEYDVVHIHAVFSHACLAAASACQKHSIPYIVRPLGSLDPWSLRQKSFKKQAMWRLGGQKMLRQAAAVQYTTRAEQRLAEAPLGLSRGVVIPLGVNQQAYATRANVAGFRAHHSGLEEHPYVVVLGRLHPKKGLELLIDAFAQAAPDNWRLVVAGDGDPTYASELKRLADQRTPGRVLFTGWVEGEDKVAALQGAALLALPSHQENFGLVVIEALACGVPVLVSPHVNLADDVQAVGAGWVVPLQPAALAQGLAEALSRPEERERRGAAGRELAAQFTWPSVAAQLTHLYAHVGRN